MSTDTVTQLVEQAPWAVGMIVIVVAFLRYLAKYNESLTEALNKNSNSVCRLAEALARLEERVDIVHDELKGLRK